MSERLDVKKTFKLVVNGAFPRSESGRSYEVTTANGKFLANVAQASRKDLRDAVVAARAGQAKWWNATAYNRGQVMYRWAEMADGSFDFTEIGRGKVEAAKARAAVDTKAYELGGVAFDSDAPAN